MMGGLTLSSQAAVLLDFTGLLDTTATYGIDDIYSQPSLTFALDSFAGTASYLAGQTVTITTSGVFQGAPEVSAGDTLFENSAFGDNVSNTITLAFSTNLALTLNMETNHFVSNGSVAETDVLTMTAGTWDNTSFAKTGGGVAPTTAFTSGDTVFTAGPTSIDGTSQSGIGAAEWQVEGTGTGFSWVHSYNRTAATFAQNAFTVTVDCVPVPEPSSAALLGLGGLAMLSRRRRS